MYDTKLYDNYICIPMYLYVDVYDCNLGSQKVGSKSQNYWVKLKSLLFWFLVIQEKKRKEKEKK